MQKKSVVLYTTAWCPHCKATLKFLDEKGVTYTNYDVEENDDKWHEGMKKSGGKDIVPIVDIEGKYFFGRFEDIKPKLELALK